jgi:hypothetical protein
MFSPRVMSMKWDMAWRALEDAGHAWPENTDAALQTCSSPHSTTIMHACETCHACAEANPECHADQALVVCPVM